MKKIFSILTLLVLLLAGCKEEKLPRPFEPPFANGLRLETEEEYDNVPECDLPDLVFKTEGHPASHSIPLPTGGDQGCLGSCASYSAVHNIMSYYVASERGVQYYNEDILRSVSFVFNQAYLGDDCTNNGSEFVSNTGRGVLNILQNYGVCSDRQMPYHKGESKNVNGAWSCQNEHCATQPNSEQFMQAKSYKIKKFHKIKSGLFYQYRVKDLLLQNYPVLFGMTVRADFCHNNFGEDYLLNAATDLGDSVGKHAMVIKGYNDSKHAYRVLNSWDPKTWGDSGEFWIDYDYFKQNVDRAYVLYYDAQNIFLSNQNVSWEYPLNNKTCNNVTGSGNYITLSYSKATFNPNEVGFVLHDRYVFPNGTTRTLEWRPGDTGLTIDIINGTLKVYLCTTFGGLDYVQENFWLTTDAGKSSEVLSFYKSAPDGANKKETGEAPSQLN